MAETNPSPAPAHRPWKAVVDANRRLITWSLPGQHDDGHIARAHAANTGSTILNLTAPLPANIDHGLTLAPAGASVSAPRFTIAEQVKERRHRVETWAVANLRDPAYQHYLRHEDADRATAFEAFVASMCYRAVQSVLTGRYFDNYIAMLDYGWEEFVMRASGTWRSNSFKRSLKSGAVFKVLHEVTEGGELVPADIDPAVQHEIHGYTFSADDKKRYDELVRGKRGPEAP